MIRLYSSNAFRWRGMTYTRFLELERRLFHIRRYNEERMLVCGDGDFSFAASIASKMAEKGIHLTATVLESETNHRETYLDSEMNTEKIQKFGHDVRFMVDATRLCEHFSSPFGK